MLNNIIGRIKLPFRKEKELYLSLYKITGQYPRNIQYYKVAFVHKSVARRTLKGKPLNNERLEFLGDAILDAIVGDIVFRRFPGKKEGFLTNTRSKLVQRSTLNRIANEMGIMRFLKWSGSTVSHNNYLGGNTFEALVGALYLDHGYDACMKFMKKRILGELINIEKVAYKEINFKSKLLEWAQKNRINLQYRLLEEKTDEKSNPIFHYQVVLENITGCDATGFSKKESQQLASKLTLEKLKKNASFLDSVFAAKTQRTKMEEEPIVMVPDIEPVPFVRESTTEPAEKPKAAVQEEDEFDLSNISHQKKTAAEIIAAAENAAYAAI
jgi:ribonuclease-3